MRAISNLSADYSTLYFDTPLKYNHLFNLETIDGVKVHTAAEVGLLTRNVKVTGNVDPQWTEFIEGCDRPFKAGKYQ